MSLSLLSVNSCAYASCGLHFRSLYDLIAHIELTHIPPFEEERQKCSSSGEDGRHNTAPNLPLSAFQRVFPTPYRPQPCAPEIVKVSFNHHRKRPAPGMKSGGFPKVTAVNRSTKSVEDDVISEAGNDDYEENSQNDTELPIRCLHVNCGKRFKNKIALKQHIRTAHNASSQEDSVAPTTETAAPPVPSATTSSPTKYAAARPHKCQQCSKRYKTTQGLQNHLTQAHHKPSGSSASTEPASPSPAVVAQLLTQARAHGQQTAQQQLHVSTERASAQLSVSSPSSSPSRGGNLPVSVAGPNSQNFLPQNAPLPVRSIQVQPSRVISQSSAPYSGGQTTGQMLQQQFNQRRQQHQQLPSHGSQAQHVQHSQHMQHQQSHSQQQSLPPHSQQHHLPNQSQHQHPTSTQQQVHPHSPMQHSMAAQPQSQHQAPTQSQHLPQSAGQQQSQLQHHLQAAQPTSSHISYNGVHTTSQPQSQLQQQLQQPPQHFINNTSVSHSMDMHGSQSLTVPSSQAPISQNSYSMKTDPMYEDAGHQQINSTPHYSGVAPKQFKKSPNTMEGRYNQVAISATAEPLKDARSTAKD
ncbi:unnamed protein product [Auanema sp. JU1783]|nr:unnamed protein product [Auanema sp. JU1783]